MPGNWGRPSQQLQRQSRRDTSGTSCDCPTCGFYNLSLWPSLHLLCLQARKGRCQAQQDRWTVFQDKRTVSKGQRTAYQVRHQHSGQDWRPFGDLLETF
eukprot:5174388-Amphidinium_carterae.1